MAIVAGVAIGFVGGAFRWCLQVADRWRVDLLTWAHHAPGPAWVVPVAVTAAGAATAAAIVRYVPLASGSGIPHVEAVARGECDRAVLLCKSGIGMEMAANKVEGVRAANCFTVELARLSRAHNDANALSLSASLLEPQAMEEVIRVWLDTPFEGGRHARRVAQLRLRTGASEF